MTENELINQLKHQLAILEQSLLIERGLLKETIIDLRAVYRRHERLSRWFWFVLSLATTFLIRLIMKGGW